LLQLVTMPFAGLAPSARIPFHVAKLFFFARAILFFARVYTWVID